jgi:hypothetical protein
MCIDHYLMLYRRLLDACRPHDYTKTVWVSVSWARVMVRRGG